MPVAMLHARPASTRRLAAGLTLAVLLGLLSLVGMRAAAAANPCGPPVTSVIACENMGPGDPPGDWQVRGSGDPTTQRFPTATSVTPRQTINFQNTTPSTEHPIHILR